MVVVDVGADRCARLVDRLELVAPRHGAAVQSAHTYARPRDNNDEAAQLLFVRSERLGWRRSRCSFRGEAKL